MWHFCSCLDVLLCNFKNKQLGLRGYDHLHLLPTKHLKMGFLSGLIFIYYKLSCNAYLYSSAEPSTGNNAPCKSYHGAISCTWNIKYIWPREHTLQNSSGQAWGDRCFYGELDSRQQHLVSIHQVISCFPKQPKNRGKVTIFTTGVGKIRTIYLTKQPCIIIHH